MNPKDFILGHGAHESPVDDRDWTLATVTAIPTVYPDSCFVDQSKMNVSMQGKIGCCVGCTYEEVVRLITMNTTGVQEELSFRFVYALAKSLEGKPGYEMYAPTDEGTYPSLVAKLVRKFGVPLAKYCPNDVSLSHEDFVYGRVFANIPQDAVTDAQNRLVGADFTVPVTEDGLKQAITYAQANNGAVAILRRIGDSYWKDSQGNITWDKNKILPIRIPAQFSSGHEELLYGYDHEEGTGRMRIYWLNHWSKAWADNGRGWEYFDVWQSHIVEARVSVHSVPVVPTFTYNFTKQLKIGDKGPDVVALQHCLKLEGVFPDNIPFTGSYLTLTQQAVRDFQTKYASEILAPLGIKNPTGIVGNNTLKKLNQLYGVK